MECRPKDTSTLHDCRWGSSPIIMREKLQHDRVSGGLTMSMKELKIKNVPEDRWHIAAALGIKFQEEFPDRAGIRDGVAYIRGSDPAYYVYRTKTQVVVVGNV